MRKLTKEAIAALKALETDEGLVKCEDIVSAAKSKRSPLHGYFTWDDGEAAHQWRLQQARFMMNVYVEIQPKTNVPLPVHVSLMEDRQNGDGGGYRRLTAVMSDKELRCRYLAQCFNDLERIQARYGHLQELAAVWDAVKAAKATHSRTRTTTGAYASV